MTLFKALLGEAFDTLPLAVRRVHDERASKRLRGRCVIERGTHPLARWFARLASLAPTMAEAQVEVTIYATPEGERWIRRFDEHLMASTLSGHDRLLYERLGPALLMFELNARSGCIHWSVLGARIFGVPLPTRWFSAVGATESAVNGLYTFDVSAHLPAIGLLVRYRGWLQDA